MQDKEEGDKERKNGCRVESQDKSIQGVQWELDGEKSEIMNKWRRGIKQR